MKDYLEKINKYFSKEEKKPTTYNERMINPKRDWNIIIISSFLLIIISGIYSYYLYTKINNDTLVTLNPTKKETEVKININLLDKLVDELNKKSESLKSLKSDTQTPRDPSI